MLGRHHILGTERVYQDTVSLNVSDSHRSRGRHFGLSEGRGILGKIQL